MTEYIDREVLEKRLNERLEFLQKEYGCHDHYTDAYAEAVDAVEETPAADVVPVVRCEDCKHVKMHVDIIGNPHLFCCNGMSIYRRKVDFGDFCSYGERKQDGDV